MKKISVSQRFIALTVVGYLTAVGAATIAVWLGTGPVLTDWQNQTIRERAEAKAQSARIVLTKLALNTQPLARNRDVVKVTIGDVSDLDRARDQVLGFNAYDEIVDVFVFDFSGEVIFRESLDNTLRASFVAEDHVMIAKEVLFDTTGEFRFSFRPGHDPGYHHFLVAQPIRYGGLVEGVLVAEVALPVSDIITLSASIGTTRLATELQSRFYVEEASGTVSVPVEGSDFYVVLQPDHELVAAAGEKLVDRVLLAVGVFLLAPFVLLSVVGLRSIVAPHKALEASQAALRENQKKLSELADIAQRSNDAIISTDLAGRTTWVNAAFVKITGYTAEEVVGRAPGEVLQGPDTDPEERARIGAALAKCEPIRSEILNYNKDGTPYWNAISIAPQIDENGKPYGFVAISSDVTEQREASEKILAAKALIEHQANHDPLTGLPNRRA
ncbi:MAG: PAS domain S-box protein, partial [Pseudomonadota bacterium]